MQKGDGGEEGRVGFVGVLGGDLRCACGAAVVLGGLPAVEEAGENLEGVEEVVQVLGAWGELSELFGPAGEAGTRRDTRGVWRVRRAP